VQPLTIYDLRFGIWDLGFGIWEEVPTYLSGLLTLFRRAPSGYIVDVGHLPCASAHAFCLSGCTIRAGYLAPLGSFLSVPVFAFRSTPFPFFLPSCLPERIFLGCSRPPARPCGSAKGGAVSLRSAPGFQIHFRG
jgi:hypothetical protein